MGYKTLLTVFILSMVALPYSAFSGAVTDENGITIITHPDMLVANGPEFTGIPCLDKSDKVVNADPAQVCRAILPKCSVLRDGETAKDGKVTEGVIAKIKNKFAWKIYGFYQGWDLDLGKTTPESYAGIKVDAPICSVVGVGKLTDNQGEINQPASIMKSVFKDCGVRPITSSDDKRTLKFKYDGENGTLWNAYLRGAYPWVIRKASYDVLGKLDENMGNVLKLISDQKIKDDLKKTLKHMQELHILLVTESADSCGISKVSPLVQDNLVSQCLGTGAEAMSHTEASRRICKLVTAQTIFNDGAITNLLMNEIMTKAQEMYKKDFADYRNSDSFGEFGDSCTGATSGSQVKAAHVKRGQNEGSRRERLACLASCLFGDGRYYTFDDWHVGKNDAEKTNNNRECMMNAWLTMDGGYQVVNQASGFSGLGSAARRGSFRGAASGALVGALLTGGWGTGIGAATGASTGAMVGAARDFAQNSMSSGKVEGTTMNQGFPAYLEKIIRRKICGQKNIHDQNNDCDKADIPSIPSEVKIKLGLK